MTRLAPTPVFQSPNFHSDRVNGDETSLAAPGPTGPPFYSVSLGIVVCPQPHARQSNTPGTKTRIYTVVYAELLIPGDGEPIQDATLVAEDKLIAWVGKTSDLPRKFTERAAKTHSVPYLMPGLWDCHAHFGGGGPEEGDWPAYMGFVAAQPIASGARLGRQCWEALQWGYTSLRDVAGFGCEVAQAIDDGSIVGPNIYSAGACLSQLAGHGDVFALPAGDVLLNLGVSAIRPGHFATNMSCIVDGVEECRRGVRLQIRRGAKCIKVLVSGGVMSSNDDPMYAQFSAEELQVIVEEAGRMHRAVAAHVHGKPGILAAVRAGVTTVEHVSFADQECVNLIKEKGVIYVATATVVRIDTGELPEENRRKLELIATNHRKAYRLAVAAGVTIALGTDTPPGYNMAKEIEYAVDAGLSNLEAIKAATANGPRTLGDQAPKTGQLKVGYEADFLGVVENPVKDVKVLQKRANIKWVWKSGKLFKGPGVGPWGEDLNSYND
ncbi:amidohydrolase [Acrodontium crateriforme]|uniref:Amidohydrolase n=1 Tax=Acrodontium crateriforme TaxID=150365 RepID=A0AAQ3M3H8_9PEZI|nr:amidohydrolase [Acrodontium crateriforme]